jgi:hypothetical protein
MPEYEKHREYRMIIANEPIEVNDDVSHEASENKEQGKFQFRWASLYTWLTYDKDKNKMYCSKCISIGFTFSPDNVRGMKQKLRTSRNKISMQIPVTGARCTIVWATGMARTLFFNGPYQDLHTYFISTGS